MSVGRQMAGEVAPFVLRPASPQDEPFLYTVYASTRLEELAVVGWEEAEKERFLRMQFQAQHQYYREQYPDAAYQLVIQEGRPIGRLYVGRWEDEIRVIDIALLPAYRRGGIGTSLLMTLLAEGDDSCKPVRIHVDRYNQAQRLYYRLGFRQIAESGPYLLLERLPRIQA